MKIDPHTPDPIPLHELNWKRLTRWIGEAREAIGHLDETVKGSPSSLFEILKWKEAIASLRSQKIEATFEEVLQFSVGNLRDGHREGLLQKIVNAKEGLEFAIRFGKHHP